WELQASGNLDQEEPVYSGAKKLRSNPVIEVNLWAYACAEKERRLRRSESLKNELEKRAQLHGDMARNVADLVERLGVETRTGWCSSCFQSTTHRDVEAGFATPTYLCQSCGAATSECVAPRCDNMATRGFGRVRIPRYC